jgi:hypothetical protein
VCPDRRKEHLRRAPKLFPKLPFVSTEMLIRDLNAIPVLKAAKAPMKKILTVLCFQKASVSNGISVSWTST